MCSMSQKRRRYVRYFEAVYRLTFRRSHHPCAADGDTESLAIRCFAFAVLRTPKKSLDPVASRARAVSMLMLDE